MTITTVTHRTPYLRVGRHRSTWPRMLHLLDVENLVSGQVGAPPSAVCGPSSCVRWGPAGMTRAP